jgi:hypothetical protein
MVHPGRLTWAVFQTHIFLLQIVARPPPRGSLGTFPNKRREVMDRGLPPCAMLTDLSQMHAVKAMAECTMAGYLACTSGINCKTKQEQLL